MHKGTSACKVKRLNKMQNKGKLMTLLEQRWLWTLSYPVGCSWVYKEGYICIKLYFQDHNLNPIKYELINRN